MRDVPIIPFYIQLSADYTVDAFLVCSLSLGCKHLIHSCLNVCLESEKTQHALPSVFKSGHQKVFKVNRILCSLGSLFESAECSIL